MIKNDKIESALIAVRAERKLRLYESIRKHIEHEDGLVNQRFTWSLNSSAFLFAGYFTLIANNDKFDKIELLLYITLATMCFFGFSSCAIYAKAIEHAEKSLNSLRNFWLIEFPEEQGIKNRFKKRGYPPIHYCHRHQIKNKLLLRIKSNIFKMSYGKKSAYLSLLS